MRVTPRLAVRLTLSAALAAAPLAALAEDFEFEVPVQLSKIDPAFAQGKVQCRAEGIDREDPRAKGIAATIGGGSATFSLTQGGFDGTVVVRFSADRPRRQPGDARAWRCGLSLVGTNGTEKLCIDPADRSAGKLPAFLNIDAASLKACAEGTIPQPK